MHSGATMTHEGEEEFSDRVELYLQDQFGPENVFRGVYLDDGDRFADFVVQTGLVDLAIEVENDFESVLTGVGQSIIYSGVDENAVPMVLVPEGHVEEPEVSIIRQQIPVVELDL